MFHTVKFLSSIILVATLVITGCTQTVWVHEKVTDGTGNTSTVQKSKGLPFYVKTEVYDQSTAWATTWLTATLTVEKKLFENKGNEVKEHSLGKEFFVKQLLKNDLDKLDRIKLMILNANQSEVKDINAVVTTFSKLPAQIDISAIPQNLVSNSFTPTWIVNEKETYYLNAPLPWFGSGNLTQEINADGTLSKVTSTPDTKLAEGLSELIPLKDYLSGKYVSPLTKADSPAAEIATMDATQKNKVMANFTQFLSNTEQVYIVNLAVEETGYLYTFTLRHPDKPTDLSPIAFNRVSGAFTRKSLGETAKPPKKKDDSKNVSITGNISFPKDWPAGK